MLKGKRFLKYGQKFLGTVGNQRTDISSPDTLFHFFESESKKHAGAKKIVKLTHFLFFDIDNKKIIINRGAILILIIILHLGISFFIFSSDLLGKEQKTEKSKKIINVDKDIVDIDVVNADLFDVLNEFGQKAGINIIIIDKKVINRKITAEFKGVDVVNALKKILGENYAFIFSKDLTGKEKYILREVMVLERGLLETKNKEFYTPKELIKLKWGKLENQAGILKLPNFYYGPQSFTIDRNGNIYLLDSINRRVKVYDKNNRFIKEIPIINSRAEDILIEDNLFFILDTPSNSITKYDFEGRVLENIKIPYEIELITGIFKDNKDILTIETAREETFKIIKEDKEFKFIKNETLGIQPQNSEAFYYTEKIDGKTGVLKIFEPKGLKEIYYRPDPDKVLGTIIFAGIDKSKKNIYVVVEELEGFKVDRKIVKYSPDGVLQTSFSLPINNYTFFFKDLRVTDDGKILFLSSTQEEVKVSSFEIPLEGR